MISASQICKCNESSINSCINCIRVSGFLKCHFDTNLAVSTNGYSNSCSMSLYYSNLTLIAIKGYDCAMSTLLTFNYNN